MSQTTPKPIFAIVGPTASGKSALGIELARRFNGEIINCDSVQVYQRIEIATAKPMLEERRAIPHHLLDFVPPNVTYTAGRWARDAARVIDEIEMRGHMVFIVGGTGFYLRALRAPLFESAPTNEHLRRRLIAIRQRRGAAYLYRLLTKLDPESATRLAPRDWSRVQRALEVRLQTGKTISEQQRTQTTAPTIYGARLRLFALAPPRAALYARINERTRAHFRAGLVEEVERLLREGVPADSNALGAHGYRRVVEFLRGARTLESALEQTQTDVRRYAKRQMTWFRREPNVEWFEGFGDDPTIQARVAARVLEEMKQETES